MTRYYPNGRWRRPPGVTTWGGQGTGLRHCRLTVDGRTHTIAEWARVIRVNSSTLREAKRRCGIPRVVAMIKAGLRGSPTDYPRESCGRRLRVITSSPPHSKPSAE